MRPTAMRRVVLLAAAIALLLAAAAVASPYKTGTYVAGDQNDGTGVKLRVRKHSFSVVRISFRERCSNETDSFSDQFTFVSGSQARIGGRIHKRGRFSGTYSSTDGKVTVSGRVRRGKATVKGSEVSTYAPGTGGTYTCRGSHSFDATRQGGY